jgi:Squalene-hopene cyclase C-terminal domain
MRDLLRMTDEELAEHSLQKELRVMTSLVLATISGGLALAGMMARFSAGDEPPLPGMNHLAGQIGWAALLIVLLLLAAWLVRGVVMKRLQWAIAISLVVHLLLCVSFHTLSLETTLAVRPEGDETDREELTLPDYGALETSAEQEAAWEQPHDTATPESEMELQRRETELDAPERIDTEERERPLELAKADAPERKEQSAFEREIQQEIERQQREQEMQTPQAVAQPNVNTSQAKTAEVEANVEQSKTDSAAPSTQRQQSQLASKDPRLEASRMQVQRSTPKLRTNDDPVQSQARSDAAAQVDDAAAENVQVSTAQANDASARERSIDASRQQATNAPDSRLAMTDGPATARSANVHSLRPDLASGASPQANATPTAGGAAALARSPSGGGPAGQAASAEAQAVSVGAAGGANAPRVSESPASSAVPRGAAATVALGTASDGTGAAIGSTPSASPTRGSGSMTRASGGASRPQLGQSEGGQLASGTGTGRRAGAVGTQAGEVAVASAASSSSKGSGTLASGPAKTSVGRQASGLADGGASERSGSPNVNSPGSGTGPATAMRSTGGAGLASRGTEPSARLDSSAGAAGGTSTGLGTARTGMSAKLPTGAEDAEQTGALVFTGPQAQPAGAGTLAGPPKSSSVPRRSAGLPGSSGAATAAPSANAGIVQPTRLTGGPARTGVGESRPTLASETQVAGLIKKSVPGIGSSPEAKISESLAMRKPESRQAATRTLGGSDASEEAVERGLVWLAQHQHADGHWSIHDIQCQDHTCTGHGSFHSDTAATGLALLAFLGAGYTHQSGQHQAVVDRAIKWHLQHQKPDGDLFADESEFVWFYSHGMASIALCEAYGLTKDPALRNPAQRALDFIVAGQHPDFGGWRYRPKFESDTSVSGWQLMALKSGEMAGLKVPKEAYTGVAHWLDSVQNKTSPGQFSYHPSRPASVAMSAEGLLMRQYLGAKRNDVDLIAGAEYLRKHLPDLNERDSYYWYYGTQVMFHMQGGYWDEWNARLRDTLVTSQLKDGGSSGSWNPDRPTPDQWGAAGGRHYVTCMNLLMLEVYYRHLPLYIELGK